MFLKSSKTKPTGGLLRFQHLVEDEEKKRDGQKGVWSGAGELFYKGLCACRVLF